MQLATAYSIENYNFSKTFIEARVTSYNYPGMLSSLPYEAYQ